MSQQPSNLLDQLKELKEYGNIRHGENVTLATAIVLLEIAASDQVVDRSERSVIHHGLKELFEISDEQASASLAEAQNYLRNMRSSSTEASMLKDTLDPITKRAVMQLIDKLIHMDGSVSGMEVYLRNRFRMLLGLGEEAS
jgi:uncharacterized tellurite resistance protein B-like protein